MLTDSDNSRLYTLDFFPIQINDIMLGQCCALEQGSVKSVMSPKYSYHSLV